MILVMSDRFKLKEEYQAPKEDTDDLSDALEDTTAEEAEDLEYISEDEDPDEVLADEQSLGVDIDGITETACVPDECAQPENIQAGPTRQRSGRRSALEPGDYRRLAGYR
jgi:hypothetical protein